MTLQKHWLNEYPEITGDEYQELCESIAKAFNPIYPIVLYEGAILDGWNRYRACLETGTQPVTTQFEGGDEEALEAVIESNRRRNMSQTAKAIMANECKKLSQKISANARERKAEAGRANIIKYHEGISGGAGATTNEPIPAPAPAAKPNPKTREQMAAAFDVSPRYVQDAKRLETHRPDLYQRCKADEISIKEARKIERDTARQERNAEQAAQAKTNPDAPIVTLASYADWLPTQPDADMILTDPPYSTDIEDIEAFAADWLPMALAKLKPTGRAYIFIGAYPKEIQAYLNVATPDQILVWTYRNTLGPTPAARYKMNWQAILYYPGPDAPKINSPNMTDQFSVHDVAAPDGRLGNRYHAWQKPDKLAERFIHHATAPGDIVLDPFCCTGTFPLAAARLGRIGAGCDISQDNLEIALGRGCRYE